MGGFGSGRGGLSAGRVASIEKRLARGLAGDTISQIARDERVCRQTVIDTCSKAVPAKPSRSNRA